MLYWMIAHRRTSHNFSLQYAIEQANTLKKPLIVLEPLNVDYPWASERFHRFVIQGMADNAAEFSSTTVHYHPYVEPAPRAGRGLLSYLASKACLVVTDDYPCFFLPRLLETTAQKLPVAMHKVDSNGLMPLSAIDRLFPTAFTFRQYIQKTARDHLQQFPDAVPLHHARTLPELEVLPPELARRWPAVSTQKLTSPHGLVSGLPVDHAVTAVQETGGEKAARKRLRRFIAEQLPHYQANRNHPDLDAASRLSSWLHFGHIGTHEILQALFDHEQWSTDQLSQGTAGKRSGWWNMSENSEAFLDQLITWRELGFNRCKIQPNYDTLETLPAWALKTINDHRSDPRPHVYILEQLQDANTHDNLWNAAQRQLVSQGHIHNYMRMLWGKKIYEWSATPEEALHALVHLNNKYATDGRDPNSYSGIFWCLGRFDRAWGPERPIYGKLRYMTSDSAARKLKLKNYLQQYGQQTTLGV